MKLPELNQQPIYYIDATPNEEYVLRILEAYRENCNCRFVSNTDNEVIKEMNRLQEKRAELLDKAINILKQEK